MQSNLFEDYLKDVHASSYSGTDDDMPTSFEGWLASMDIGTLIEYANMAIQKAVEITSKNK